MYGTAFYYTGFWCARVHSNASGAVLDFIDGGGREILILLPLFAPAIAYCLIPSGCLRIFDIFQQPDASGIL